MDTIYDFNVSINKIADDFYEAYKKCLESTDYTNTTPSKKIYKVLNIPAIINASFACELYLKSIINDKINEHNLKKLYYKLEPKIQNELKEMINTKLQNLNWNKDFIDYLDDISNVFTFWRYIHEKNKNIGFLGDKINEYLQVFPVFLEAIKVTANKYKNN